MVGAGKGPLDYYSCTGIAALDLARVYKQGTSIQFLLEFQIPRLLQKAKGLDATVPVCLSTRY